jgi:hypothetical protein
VALAAVDGLEGELAGDHAYQATAPNCCVGWAAARSRARRTTRPSSWPATPPRPPTSPAAATPWRSARALRRPDSCY